MCFSSRIGRLLASPALLSLLACAPSQETADRVLLNGTIVTVDERLGQVQALAIRDERIVAVGSDREIRSYIGPETGQLDLQGRFAIPGFIEGHGHFLSLGESETQLKLADSKSWDDVIRKVAAAVEDAAPGEWILGRGWHQSKWSSPPDPNVDGLPLHQALSRVSPHNPVLLEHASGHASLANKKAMDLASIDRATPDPPGGKILRDRSGRATGALRETAAGLVSRVLEAPRESRSSEQRETEWRRWISRAAEASLANGVTSFQDAGSSFQFVDLVKRMVDEGELPVRLWVMLNESNASLASKIGTYRIIDHGENRLTVRAIKRSIDGALGSHGAWLLEPYSDLPSSSGLNTLSMDALRETARLAAQHDFQLCVHAIGDRGNREALDVFEDAFSSVGSGAGRRWRIEHAQHLHPDDVPRFVQLGAIASMQGVHCTSDGPWISERLGRERAEQGSYLWKTLMASGALVTNGTDVPVEDISPIASFYSTVSRRLPSGEVLMPQQRLTRMEALRTYTIHNARAAFEERDKGSLSPGKLADITVLDRNILTVPEEDIPNTRVVHTLVGGRVEYSNPAFE